MMSARPRPSLSLLTANLSSASPPQNPLVITSHSPWDFEYVFSMQIFIRNAGVRNPLMLQLADYSPEGFPEGSLAKSLSKILKNLSEQGGNGFIPFKISPSQACFSFGIGGPGLPDCESLGKW